MKRLMLALCLAVVTAAAQAESSGDRVPRSSRHASATSQKPSPVSALFKWLAQKARPNPANAPAQHHALRTVRHHALRHHREPVADAPAAVPATATLASAPAVVPAAPPDPAAADAPIRHQEVRDPAASAPAPAATVAAAPDDVSAPPPDPAAASMPRAVATITVTPQLYKNTARSGGYHSCSSGERIITAYYWEGKHTASGEPFNPDGFTAAHRTLPFGTKLLVVNPRNGKSVTVRVNDRGPFVKGVTLDLSRGAAKAIGMQGTGAVCMAKM
jgi:rare lipoprotein A